MLALLFILLASLALTYAYRVPLTRTSRLSHDLQRSHSTRTMHPLKSFEVSDVIDAQTLAEQEGGSEQALAPLKLIIAGAPAAGKGTQCANIVEKFNVVHLSTGDMLRAAMKEGSELGVKAKEYMDNAQLVPDELITNVVCERLQQEDCQSRGWLLDGFPRTLPQALALESAGMVPDCFLLLNVPQEALVERVTGRRTDPDTGKIYHMTLSPPPADDEPLLKRLVQRSDDTEEKIVVRYQDFLKHVGAIRACYNDVCVEIDGTMTPSEVGTKINGALETKQTSNNANAMAALSERRANNLEARNLVGGLYGLYTADRLLAMAFAKANFNSFPSALVGMIMLFGGLCTVDKINPEKASDINFTLTPASAFLKLWLTLLLIPPIVAAPLKVQLFRENGLKMLAIIVGGFIFNVSSAGWLASPFGAGSSKTTTSEGIAAVMTHDSSSSSRRVPRLPTLPAFTTPAIASLASFVVCVLSTSLAFDSVAESSRRIFGTALTVSSYLFAVQQTPKNLQSVLHPALASASAIIAGYGALGVATGEGTKTALMSYFGQGSGPGDVLFKLLGTAIISFGVQLFQYRRLLNRNKLRFLRSTLFTAVSGLVSSALGSRVLRVSGVTSQASILTRAITTPLALAASKITGADPTLTSAISLFTGIIGASIGSKVLRMQGVEDDVSVGIATGAAAHSLGAASVASNPVRFASAVVAMCLTGVWTVVLLSIPQARVVLLRLAAQPALPLL